ncbi:hypothetical protein KEM52_000354, partial [Ascosphaera acerosa]
MAAATTTMSTRPESEVEASRSARTAATPDGGVREGSTFTTHAESSTPALDFYSRLTSRTDFPSSVSLPFPTDIGVHETSHQHHSKAVGTTGSVARRFDVEAAPPSFAKSAAAAAAATRSPGTHHNSRGSKSSKGSKGIKARADAHCDVTTTSTRAEHHTKPARLPHIYVSGTHVLPPSSLAATGNSQCPVTSSCLQKTLSDHRAVRAARVLQASVEVPQIPPRYREKGAEKGSSSSGTAIGNGYVQRAHRRTGSHSELIPSPTRSSFFAIPTSTAAAAAPTRRRRSLTASAALLTPKLPSYTSSFAIGTSAGSSSDPSISIDIGGAPTASADAPPRAAFAGVREMDRYVSLISKENFDLKLRLHQKAQQMSTLHGELRRLAAVEGELTAAKKAEKEAKRQARSLRSELMDLQEEHVRLNESNDLLMGMLRRRDDGLKEAAAIICELEDTIETLQLRIKETGHPVTATKRKGGQKHQHQQQQQSHDRTESYASDIWRELTAEMEAVLVQTRRQGEKTKKKQRHHQQQQQQQQRQQLVKAASLSASNLTTGPGVWIPERTSSLRATHASAEIETTVEPETGTKTAAKKTTLAAAGSASTGGCIKVDEPGVAPDREAAASPAPPVTRHLGAPVGFADHRSQHEAAVAATASVTAQGTQVEESPNGRPQDDEQQLKHLETVADLADDGNATSPHSFIKPQVLVSMHELRWQLTRLAASLDEAEQLFAEVGRSASTRRKRSCDEPADATAAATKSTPASNERAPVLATEADAAVASSMTRPSTAPPSHYYGVAPAGSRARQRSASSQSHVVVKDGDLASPARARSRAQTQS